MDQERILCKSCRRFLCLVGPVAIVRLKCSSCKEYNEIHKISDDLSAASGFIFVDEKAQLV
jgi:phage FluMu protein Com